MCIFRGGHRSLQPGNIREADLSIYGHAELNGGRLNGDQRPNIGVAPSAAVIHTNSRIRRINRSRTAEARNQNRGKSQRPVEALTIELAQTGRRLFSMPDSNNRFLSRYGRHNTEQKQYRKEYPAIDLVEFHRCSYTDKKKSNAFAHADVITALV